MTMTTMDCMSCQEWLDAAVDGLSGAAAAEVPRGVARHLEACADCRAERAALGRLHGALTASRVAVADGFSDRVMARLPVTGWEARTVAAWRLPLALLAVLGGAAAAVVGMGSAQLHPGLPFAGAFAAVADLFQTALLAGAGLLAASWTGVGAVIGERVGASPGTLIALIGLVAGVDLLLLSLLRRRPAPAVEPADPDGARRHEAAD